MNKKDVKVVRQLPLMVAVAIIGMLIVEYCGWLIIEKIEVEGHFPGLISWEFWNNVLVNIFGAMILVLLAICTATICPKFRKEPLRYIHIPIWFGIGLFITLMVTLAAIGLVSV
ncbi:MAG: hypothetical protein JJU46_05900 [Balneolaceae bacterium]|nr:hypothetical protein [Balneolaceae bacterium]